MKKQQNVQEQIQDTRISIQKTAKFWRNNLPEYVVSILKEKDINNFIMIDYDRL